MNYITLSGSNSLQARIGYTVTQDTDANQSVVTICELWVCDQGTTGIRSWSGDISLSGKPVVQLGIPGQNSNTAYMMPGQFVKVSGIREESFVVTHLKDGSGVVTLQVNLRYGSGTMWNLSVRKSLNLPIIQRKTSISISSMPQSNLIYIYIQKADPSFTVTLRYTCAEASGTIATRTASNTITWSVPIELAEQAPDSSTIRMEITALTEYGTKTLNTVTRTVSWPVPATVVPQIRSVTLSDPTGISEICGGWLQSVSVLRLTVDAEGAYGSTIRSISVSCGNLTGSGSPADFSLPDAGTFPIRVTALDSRGRKAEYDTEVTVLPYAQPRVSIASLFRSDGQSRPQSDGIMGTLYFSADVSALAGSNRVRYSLQLRRRGESEWQEYALGNLDDSFTLAQVPAIFPEDSGTVCEVRVAATDRFHTAFSEIRELPETFALLDFHGAERAVGIAHRADSPGRVSIGLDTTLLGHRLTELAEPEAGSDAATRAYADTRSRLDVLWTNASPGSSFGTESDSVSVPVDLSGCSWVICIFRQATSNGAACAMAMAPVGGSGAVMHCLNISDSTSASAIIRRSFSVTGSEVSISRCRVKSTNERAAATTNNTYLIPMWVIGIRGVASHG